jgi:hypothetical protein
MDEEYDRQKTRGGIIDKEMEDNRFLVVTENTSATSSAEVPSIKTEEDFQQSQSQPEIKVAPVQASVISKPVASKSDWSRAQHHRRAPRGKWIRSSEIHSKERVVSAHNQSNPPNRQSSTEKHNSQPRHRAEESNVQPAEPRSVSAAPPPPPAAQIRPPPGFAPR